MTRIEHNQNLFGIDHNIIHGPKQISSAHTGSPWARVNSDVGTKCAWDLDISFITGIIGEWFGSFLAPDSKIAQLAKNIFLGSSGAFFGMREDSMYRHIYASEAKLSDEVLKDQNQANRKVSRLDDFGEVTSLFKDKVINKMWRFTKLVSTVQPIALAVAPFLGEKLSDLVFSVLQTPSRLTWRLTYMFPNALENKFVERICKLGWLSIKSIFSTNAKRDLDNLKTELKKDAQTYVDKMQEYRHLKKDPELNKKSPLGAYCWMLMNRIDQHWQGWKNSATVIRQKIERGELEGTNESKRIKDPSQILTKGFIDQSGNNDASKHDIKEMERFSLVNLTAPFCGAIGVFGSCIAEPLRLIWNLAGIKTGTPFLSFLSSLRAPASFVNYAFKFFSPEFNRRREYNELKEKIESNPNIGTAAKVLLANKKRRFIAGASGLALTGLSFVDSFMNLFVRDESTRSLKFLRGVIKQLVNTGFVRFFSERTGFWGERELINQSVQKILGKEYVTDKDIEDLPQNYNDQFLHHMETLGKEVIDKERETQEAYYEPVFGELSEGWGSVLNRALGLKVA